MSAPVLSGELLWRPEVAPPSERALRQRRVEVFPAFVGEPRRGGGLVADQALIRTWLEQVREAAPGNHQGRAGRPHALDRRLVRFAVQAGLLAVGAAGGAAVVIRSLQAAQVQHITVDEGSRAGVQVQT